MLLIFRVHNRTDKVTLTDKIEEVEDILVYTKHVYVVTKVNLFFWKDLVMALL